MCRKITLMHNICPYYSYNALPTPGNKSRNPTTKTTTQTENRLRNVEYSENAVRSDIQALYDQILEKRAAYDAAKTAYESGKMVWDAAQIQKQNGSLSQIQYLQQELAWLTTESGYHCAGLELQQAIQNYRWAVAGAAVSVS